MIPGDLQILFLFFQLDDAVKIKNTDIAKELCLPPVKLHCSSKSIKEGEGNLLILIGEGKWHRYYKNFFSYCCLFFLNLVHIILLYPPQTKFGGYIVILMFAVRSLVRPSLPISNPLLL